VDTKERISLYIAIDYYYYY